MGTESSSVGGGGGGRQGGASVKELELYGQGGEGGGYH